MRKVKYVQKFCSTFKTFDAESSFSNFGNIGATNVIHATER